MNRSKLTELLKPTVESLGYILWGCEYLSQGKHSVLRLYIDKEGGVVLDDCALVSRQVGQLLDVEDPIQSNYALEVSSPGLDRPLFDAWQYQQFQGSKVSLKLYQSINGTKKLIGLIDKINDGVVQLDVGGEMLDIPLDIISKANLVS